jgi:Tol biopolymer transport system component
MRQDAAMLRRGLAIGAFLCVAAMGLGTTAGAAVLDGPSLSYLRFGLKPEVSEVRISSPDGSVTRKLVGGGFGARPLPYPYSDLAWTPDGTRVVFSAARRVRYLDPEPRRHSLHVLDVETGSIEVIPGTHGALQPVMAPDGRTIAFKRLKHGLRRNSAGRPREWYRSSLWRVAIDGSELRRIRPWREGGGEWPESFSPDGRVLLITRGQGNIIALTENGGELGVISREAWDPVYSPDGSKLALIRFGEETGDPEAPRVVMDLFVLDFARGNEVQLTETEAMETDPGWDPSGERIVFKQRSNAAIKLAGKDFGDAILQINADGTCLTKTFSSPGAAYQRPAWRPGPGRGAGPISC